MIQSPKTSRVFAGNAEIDFALQCVSNDGRAIFIVDKKHSLDSIRVISHARASTLANEVLIHVSRLSPLGLSTLVEILDSVKTSLSSAQLFALAHDLEEHIRCQALLKSVSKLQVATPSLIQHFMGWWPSTKFIAEAHGPVVSAAKTQVDDDILSFDEPQVLVIQEDPPKSSQQFLSDLIDVAQPSTVIYRSLADAEYWGNSPELQWCFAPANLDTFTGSIERTSERCRWCHENFVPPVCPVCSSFAPNGEQA